MMHDNLLIPFLAVMVTASYPDKKIEIISFNFTIFNTNIIKTQIYIMDNFLMSLFSKLEITYRIQRKSYLQILK